MKQPIPTNIITGFLGVGKTTAIKNLLLAKPSHENWSVLVNEFGEIGIDGTIFKEQGVSVREVPGGCMCCVAGLPMKVALNFLIATTKPDRIIIEPTGLGHPADVIASLTAEDYQDVIELRATVTLVDPRKLSDSRYTEHQTFNDQIAVADVLIGNKIDACSADDLALWNSWSAELTPPKTPLGTTEQGIFPLAWLDLPRHASASVAPAAHQQSRLNPRTNLVNPKVALPEGQDFVRRENASADGFSVGWLIRPDWVFHFNPLFGWLSGLDCWRAKAVMRTQEGVYLFNAENGVLTINEFQGEAADSRIEIIDDKKLPVEELEATLLSLRIND